MTTEQRFRVLMDAPQDILAKVDLLIAGRSDIEDENRNRTITAKDAAKRLGVSRPTVYRMVRDNELRTVTIRGVNRIWLPSVLGKVPAPLPAPGQVSCL